MVGKNIVMFLTRKWQRELDYRLTKELWAFTENRIAVRFAYEYHDDSDSWFRAYGNENWECDEFGLNRRRHASINVLPIKEAGRKFLPSPIHRGQISAAVFSRCAMCRTRPHSFVR